MTRQLTVLKRRDEIYYEEGFLGRNALFCTVIYKGWKCSPNSIGLLSSNPHGRDFKALQYFDKEKQHPHSTARVAV